MPRNPSSEVLDQFSSIMRREVFGGNIKGFTDSFRQYLAQHGDLDPHGRHLLSSHFNTGAGLLSFRSTSTDHNEIAHQFKIRWDAWMEILPLDLQMTLLIYEDNPRMPAPVDLASLKWDQWWGLLDSPDPSTGIQKSPLCSIAQTMSDEPCAQSDWEKIHTSLVNDANSLAYQMAAWKQWDRLASWMQASRIHAFEQVNVVYVHHKDRNSRGSTRADVAGSMPFWATGVFVGASDAEFWDVMSRFGGPGSAGQALGMMAPPGPSSRGVPFAQTPAINQWVDPMSWIEPAVPLQEAAALSVKHTHARWLQQAMLENVDRPGASPGRSPNRF